MSKKVQLKGIDVSSFQGKIDWEKAKDEIDFAVIRCGFGGDYESQDDVQWKNNIAACEKYEIPYGVYLYSYATTAEKARSEAAHVLRLLKGYRPELPVFYDLEESRISALGNRKILEIAKVFCDVITNAGYLYGTYANKNWFSNYLTDKWYDNYPKWIAQYNSSVTYKGTYDIWQYTDKGTVSGIKGSVDMNIAYVSFLRGDVNSDGKITAADARLALRFSAGLENLTQTQQYTADMNDDSKVTAADAREILQKSAEVQ
ncbi:MAG: glycosyl hydrolase family 25 [Clostridia bacterium]|nr:glycosyl hydrolase family 25 [Clostridia bacterium]